MLGQGDLDPGWAQMICESGYTVAIGMRNRAGHGAESRLEHNLEGLDGIADELPGRPTPSRTPRTP